MMDVYRSLSDSELVGRLNQSDKKALEEVYLRYWGVLYDYARKLLREDAIAEDIVHDIFTYLLMQMGDLDIKAPLQFYLYRSVRNRIINEYNKHQNRKKYIDSLKSFAEQGSYITDEVLVERELKNRIEQAVANFPPKMREVFEMSRTSHLSRREIALATNVTEGTVNTQLNRALKILRSKLTSLLF
jgi:RNA polymerase sigma-70 factor (ECF subfamily)